MRIIRNIFWGDTYLVFLLNTYRFVYWTLAVIAPNRFLAEININYDWHYIFHTCSSLARHRVASGNCHVLWQRNNNGADF